MVEKRLSECFPRRKKNPIGKNTSDIGDVEGRTESGRGLREQGLAGRGNSWLEREVDRSTGLSFFRVPLLLVEGSGERSEGNRERGRVKDERQGESKRGMVEGWPKSSAAPVRGRSLRSTDAAAAHSSAPVSHVGVAFFIPACSLLVCVHLR